MNQAEDYQSYDTVNESNESLKRSFEYVVYVNRVNRFSKINRLHAPTMLSGNGPWMNMKNSQPMVTESLYFRTLHAAATTKRRQADEVHKLAMLLLLVAAV